MTPFGARRPVRAPSIQRVQDNVPTIWRVKLTGEFKRRVIDDRGVATCVDLLQQLSNQGGLAGSGITHNQNVTRLDRARNPEGRRTPPYAVALDQCDSVGRHATVELPDRDELRPFHPTSVAPAPSPDHVDGD